MMTDAEINARVQALSDEDVQAIADDTEWELPWYRAVPLRVRMAQEILRLRAENIGQRVSLAAFASGHPGFVLRIEALEAERDNWQKTAKGWQDRWENETAQLEAEADLYRRGYELIGAADISNYLAKCQQARNIDDLEAENKRLLAIESAAKLVMDDVYENKAVIDCLSREKLPLKTVWQSLADALRGKP